MLFCAPGSFSCFAPTRHLDGLSKARCQCVVCAPVARARPLVQWASCSYIAHCLSNFSTAFGAGVESSPFPCLFSGSEAVGPHGASSPTRALASPHEAVVIGLVHPKDTPYYSFRHNLLLRFYRSWMLTFCNLMFARIAGIPCFAHLGRCLRAWGVVVLWGPAGLIFRPRSARRNRPSSSKLGSLIRHSVSGRATHARGHNVVVQCLCRSLPLPLTWKHVWKTGLPNCLWRYFRLAWDTFAYLRVRKGTAHFPGVGLVRLTPEFSSHRSSPR